MRKNRRSGEPGDSDDGLIKKGRGKNQGRDKTRKPPRGQGKQPGSEGFATMGELLKVNGSELPKVVDFENVITEKLKSVISEISTFLKDSDKAPAEATPEEMALWQNIIDEAQTIWSELKDQEKLLSEESDQLLRDAENIFSFIKKQRDDNTDEHDKAKNVTLPPDNTGKSDTPESISVTNNEATLEKEKELARRKLLFDLANKDKKIEDLTDDDLELLQEIADADKSAKQVNRTVILGYLQEHKAYLIKKSQEEAAKKTVTETVPSKSAPLEASPSRPRESINDIFDFLNQEGAYSNDKGNIKDLTDNDLATIKNEISRLRSIDNKDVSKADIDRERRILKLFKDALAERSKKAVSEIKTLTENQKGLNDVKPEKLAEWKDLIQQMEFANPDRRWPQLLELAESFGKLMPVVTKDGGQKKSTTVKDTAPAEPAAPNTAPKASPRVENQSGKRPADIIIEKVRDEKMTPEQLAEYVKSFNKGQIDSLRAYSRNPNSEHQTTAKKIMAIYDDWQKEQKTDSDWADLLAAAERGDINDSEPQSPAVAETGPTTTETAPAATETPATAQNLVRIRNAARLQQLKEVRGWKPLRNYQEAFRQAGFVNTNEVDAALKTILENEAIGGEKQLALFLKEPEKITPPKAKKPAELERQLTENIQKEQQNQKEANLREQLIENIAKEVGLDQAIIKEIFDQQEQKLLEQAALEEKTSTPLRQRLYSALKKASGYAALGIGVGLMTGGVGLATGAAIFGAKLADNVLGYRKNKTKVNERFEAKKQAILQGGENNPELQSYIEGVYADIAIAKAKQIESVPINEALMGLNKISKSGEGDTYTETNQFGTLVEIERKTTETRASFPQMPRESFWKKFVKGNPEMVGQYEAEQQEKIIAALEAIDSVRAATDQREQTAMEKMAAFLEISPAKQKKLASFLAKTDTVFGEKDLVNRTLAAGVYSLIGICLRGSSMGRIVSGAMAGFKLGGAVGDLAANKLLGKKNDWQDFTVKESTLENYQTLQEQANYALQLIANAEKAKEREKEINATKETGRDIIKASSRVLGAAAGGLLGYEITNLFADHQAAAAAGAPAEKPTVPAEHLTAVAGEGEGEGEISLSGEGEESESVFDSYGVVKSKIGSDNPEISIEPVEDIPGGINETEAPYNIEDQIWPKGEHGIEETLKAGAATETAKVAETTNPLTLALEKMSAVPGDKAKHLWGLIDAKAGAFVGELDVDLTKSEGRMTWVVDAIKDKIADNPEKFGLPKGINIDLLSKEQLTELAANKSFNLELNNLLIDQDHGLIDAATALKAEAVSNIEANNAFYAKTAPTLEVNHPLGQADYNLMDKMHAAGEHLKTVATEAGKTIPIPDHETVREGVEAVKNSASEVASQVVAEAPTVITPEIATQHTEFIRTLGDLNLSESQQNELSQYLAKSHLDLEKFGASEWSKLFLAFKEGSRDDMAKYLEGIFKQAGADKFYEGNNFNLNSVTKTVDSFGGRDVVVFETPFPSGAEDANVLGPVKFQYDPGNNKLVAIADGHRFGDNYGDNISPQNKLKLLLEDIRKNVTLKSK